MQAHCALRVLAVQYVSHGVLPRIPLHSVIAGIGDNRPHISSPC
jgi:hypothetical protein